MARGEVEAVVSQEGDTVGIKFIEKATGQEVAVASLLITAVAAERLAEGIYQALKAIEEADDAEA